MVPIFDIHHWITIWDTHSRKLTGNLNLSVWKKRKPTPTINFLCFSLHFQGLSVTHRRRRWFKKESAPPSTVSRWSLLPLWPFALPLPKCLPRWKDLQKGGEGRIDFNKHLTSHFFLKHTTIVKRFQFLATVFQAQLCCQNGQPQPPPRRMLLLLRRSNPSVPPPPLPMTPCLAGHQGKAVNCVCIHLHSPLVKTYLLGDFILVTSGHWFLNVELTLKNTQFLSAWAIHPPKKRDLVQKSFQSRKFPYSNWGQVGFTWHRINMVCLKQARSQQKTVQRSCELNLNAQLPFQRMDTFKDSDFGDSSRCTTEKNRGQDVYLRLWFLDGKKGFGPDESSGSGEN